MFRALKMMLLAAVVVGLTAGAALAQGYRDAGAKARGEFGTGFHSGGSRTMTAYRAMPTYIAPQVVQTAPAPTIAPRVAQTPTERRSFSAEPSQDQAAPMAPAAPAAPQVIRSYRYEPTAPVYNAPVRSRRASTPSYLLPRTDPGKHGS
jgi:hypothetical protein